MIYNAFRSNETSSPLLFDVKKSVKVPFRLFSFLSEDFENQTSLNMEIFSNLDDRFQYFSSKMYFVALPRSGGTEKRALV